MLPATQAGGDATTMSLGQSTTTAVMYYTVTKRMLPACTGQTTTTMCQKETISTTRQSSTQGLCPPKLDSPGLYPWLSQGQLT